MLHQIFPNVAGTHLQGDLGPISHPLGRSYPGGICTEQGECEVSSTL